MLVGIDQSLAAEGCFERVWMARNSTVRIYFTGTEDASLQTSVFLDDFTLP